MASPSASVATTVCTAVWFSATLTAMLEVKTGAFVPTKIIVTVAAAEEDVPSEAVTVNVFAPPSFAAGT